MRSPARNPDGTPIAAMTIGSMRTLGVRDLEAWCEEALCSHHAVVDGSTLPPELPVPAVALRLRCSACGSRNVSTRPLWTQHHAHGAGRV